VSCMGKYGVAKAIVYDLAVTFRTYLSVGNFVVGTFFPKLWDEASILMSELCNRTCTIRFFSDLVL
jgi:hypothetical protein